MDSRIEKAISQIKAGKKQLAYRLLIEVIKEDPKGENAEPAWLWLSTIVETAEQKRKCLETVLALNPKNDFARMRLMELANSEPSIPTNAQTQAIKSSVPKTKKRKLTLPVVLSVFAIAIISCCGLLFLAALLPNEPSSANPTRRPSGVSPDTNNGNSNQTNGSAESFAKIYDLRCEGVDDYDARYVTAIGSVGNLHSTRALRSVRLRVITYSDISGQRILGNTDWGYPDSNIIFPISLVSFSINVARQPGVSGCNVLIESASFAD